MATVILLRHGRTTANADGVLAGRLPGVRLDETGQVQAEAAAERLRGVTVARLVASPLERCIETAAPVASVTGLEIDEQPDLVECDYGSWQGRTLKELGKEKLWRVVQDQPAAMVFPDGEPLATMATRAATAVRRIDAEVEAEHGAGAVWVAVTHGDVVKAVLADALGMHLDAFQRLVVDPASISVVRHTTSRPFVLGVNTVAGPLDWLTPPHGRKRRRTDVPAGDAVVGGGAGHDSAPPA